MADDDEFITSRFTKNEMKIIKTFMKKNKIKNKNKFVHKAIEDMLGITLADSNENPPILPAQYLTVYQFYQDFRKKLKSTPKIQTQMDTFFREWTSKLWPEWNAKDNEILGFADKIWDEFRAHEKVGRPKNPKKKRRGHKDTLV